MREAIIDLSDEEIEALGFGDLVSMVREAGIVDLELLEDEGTGNVSQLEVKNRLDEDRLDTLESVESWELITQKADTYLYLLELITPEMPEQAGIDHDDLVGVCDPTVTDRGMLLSLVGSQDAIRNMIRNFEEAGVTPDLHSLGEYEGGERALESLTDRQLEVLQTAYDMGFYEVPKRATIDEVAAEIGLDGGTVSEHLQRAERNLLTQQLIA